eukprot:gene4371-5111_t
MTEVMIDSELLTCPICSDTFVDACDTSCGHTFCEFCLNSCLESRADKCPVCSKDPSPIHAAFTIRSICEAIAPHVPKSPDDEGKTLDSEKEQGNASYAKNKYAEAIAHYNNAIDRVTNSSDPKNCVLYNNRAQCYIHLRQYQRALLDCDEAIRLNDTNGAQHNYVRTTTNPNAYSNTSFYQPPQTNTTSTTSTASSNNVNNNSNPTTTTSTTNTASTSTTPNTSTSRSNSSANIAPSTSAPSASTHHEKKKETCKQQ